MKWNSLGIVSGLQGLLRRESDFDQAVIKDPQGALPQGVCGEY